MALQEEEQMHRRISEEFIRHSPVEITLWRQDRIDNGAGGTILSDPYQVTVEPQTMCFVARSSQGTPTEGISGSIQDVQIPKLYLIAKHDADIQEGDFFDHDGENYVIDKLLPMQRWRKRAEVENRG